MTSPASPSPSPTAPARQGPDVAFWQQRFESRDTPWDRGCVNPQLLHWLSEGAIDARSGVIAVPGCGFGHEVAALAQAGSPVVAIDYAPAAVAQTQRRLSEQRLRAEVVQADVLAWRPGAPLAAVYEQTCLCALHPDLWTAYAAQLHGWLRPGGRLFALFMQAPRDSAGEGFIEGPPYHCHIHAMRSLFPAPLWEWPKPPYRHVPHPRGFGELAVILTRR
jgi:SAM-dependent methyltransferase